MRRVQKCIGTIVIIISFYSCAPIYLPNTVIPTEFKERNDIRIAGSTSLIGAFANTAYSPIKHTYIHLEGGTWHDKTNNLSGGIGFYKALNEQYQVEAQGSIGLGSFDREQFSSTYSSYLATTEGDYDYWSSQISISRNFINDDFSLSLAFRYTDLDVKYKNSNLDNDVSKLTGATIGQWGTHFIVKNRIAPHFSFFSSMGYESAFVREGRFTRYTSRGDYVGDFKKTKPENEEYFFNHAGIYYRVGIVFDW